MPDPRPAAVRCPSCGGANVRVVGTRTDPPYLELPAASVTRNYQCADCFHRWAATIPAGDRSRRTGP